jgi:hypothetical protein
MSPTSPTRGPQTVRSRVVWGLIFLAAFATGVVLTSEPGERVRQLSILPFAAVLYAANQWFYARRDRRNRDEPEGMDDRLTRR